ncbi:MAG TPA: hypothetical protein VIH97_14455 [Candidatus Acidoferrales bacterium]
MMGLPIGLVKRERVLVWVVAAIACLAPALVYAEHTRTWHESAYADFEKGTAKGVAIRSDGKLALAPKFAAFSDPNLAYLWTLRVDSRGRIYGAGGSDAKVVRFDDPAKPTTVFEAPELSAQAIAFDAHDNLYVGTSPDGKIYKVTPDGQKSVFFEPKTKYIWALAIDSQGTLFAGTGDTGEIFAITPDGKGQVFYQSDERHARSLAFDAKGNLLVGTDPDGLILRIEPVRKNATATPQAGQTFVIYETSKKEITALIADASGTIYAAAIGEKQRTAPAVPTLSGVLTPQQNAPVVGQPASGATITLQAQGPAPTPQPVAAFSFFQSTTGGSEVVKISPEGSPETVWTSREDLIFAMALETNGNVLLGTGNKGSIVELEKNRNYAKVASTAAAQVTSLIATPDGKILAGTANPGKVFTLGPGYESEGSFESDTFDAKIFSHWGRITWMGDGAGRAAANVAFYVRSGNTASPEKNWSAWSGPYKNGSGETAGCPPARFVQWKVVFLGGTKPGSAASSARVSWVDVAYQPENVAPVMDDIVIQDPGVRVQGFAAIPGGPGTPTAVQLRLPQRPGAQTFVNFGATADALQRMGRVDVTPQGFSEKGYASVLWSAHDDNDDDLIFAVYYRGETENTWHLLKDKLAQRFYSWDSTTMPDGAYYLKITASDLPSNPPAQALTDERVSDRFEIANTPPRIENLRADAASNPVKVSFDGISSSVSIARAQYSVDAGDWLTVFPTGLLSDAPKEAYQIPLAGLTPGQHIISVQVSDRYENAAAAKIVFTVPTK